MGLVIAEVYFRFYNDAIQKEYSHFPLEDRGRLFKRWERFHTLVKFVPYHGFHEHVICHAFYFVLSSDSKQITRFESAWSLHGFDNRRRQSTHKSHIP
jgi:hypothetical protein